MYIDYCLFDQQLIYDISYTDPGLLVKRVTGNDVTA